MKTVVQGLVAFAAVFVAADTAHGLTFIAIGQGDDINETLSVRATSAVTDLRLVIPLLNAAIFDLKNGIDTLSTTFFQLICDLTLTRSWSPKEHFA